MSMIFILSEKHMLLHISD